MIALWLSLKNDLQYKIYVPLNAVYFDPADLCLQQGGLLAKIW